ncbi:MAG: sensor histidine kinase [Verrucomicrobiales bacterium]
MIWKLLTFFAIALAIAVFYWSRKKMAQLQQQLDAKQRELKSLTDQNQSSAIQAAAEQQALFNSMVEGFLLLDAQGKIRATNRSLERMFSLTGDLRGKTIMETIRIHELLAVTEKVQREGEVQNFEFDLPGIQNRCVQVNAAAIVDKQRRHQGSIFIFHDLSRVKELENTRRDFVANVSHELRTPLTLIKGYVETLQEGAMHDPQVAERFLGIIAKHSDRLTYLIEDLLTISRLESGQIQLNLQEVEARAVAQRVVTDLQKTAAERGVTLKNEIGANLITKADPERLQQVFYNLVDNAIKYGRPKGEVLLSGMDKGRVVELRVQDNGPGIPPDSLDRIFERFYRVDRARSRDQGGTGLGLSIVKHIVHSHGGEVWAESELGKGATIFLTIPSEKRSTRVET